MKKAIIIGAGIGGLASSVRLALLGYEVEVFESNSWIGGKARAFKQDQFRFDAGPSLFTMPHLVEELFLLAGKDSKDYFEFYKQEISCRYAYEDGTVIQAFSDPKKMATEVAQKLNVEEEVVLEYFNQSGRLYRLTHKIFLERSLHKVENYFSTDVLKALANVFSLDLFQSMHKTNEKRLSHPKLVQLFDRFATYNGSSPYQAPGVLNMIPHLEHGIGTFFPKGGMESIPRSIHQLALDLGVKFHVETTVEKIKVEQGRAIGVQVQGEVILSDIIISNVDIVPTYRNLLKNYPAPEKTLSREPSSSALIFYWGIKGTFQELELHNIFFSRDYESEFDHLFNKKSIIDDPTVYINVSSKVEKEDAPEGCENWFVMVNAPSDVGQDWGAEVAATKSKVLKKLSNMLGRTIEPLIQTEQVLTPPMIEQQTGSYAGALYGSSSNDRMAAFLRHPNFSSKIRGLYFCGGSVHPGGGIPLCLLSARIAVDLIEKNE